VQDGIHDVRAQAQDAEVAGRQASIRREAEAAQRPVRLAVRVPERHAQMRPDRQVAGDRHLRGRRILGRIVHHAGHQALGHVVAEALLERRVGSDHDRVLRRLGVGEAEHPVTRDELRDEADIHRQMAADRPQDGEDLFAGASGLVAKN
jgi:hypothetical protein